MHEAFKIFILSTIVINLWTVFLLLQDKRGNKLLNRWFAAFLVALALPQMDLYANQVVPGGIYKLGVMASSFLWLKGPFICIFVKVLNRDQINIRTAGIHFLPWLFVAITLALFPQTILPCMLMGMCHMLCYLFFSLWRLMKMRPYLADLWHGFPNSAYYWLLYVIGGVMTLVAIDFVVMSLVISGVLNTYELLDYFAFPVFSIYVLSVGILSVYRPEMLFRENSKAATENYNDEGTAEFVSVEPAQRQEKNPAKDKQLENETLPEKERHLELDVSLAQSLSQHLTSLMQEQHIYRENELSLIDLANYLGISANQASELLNVHTGLSFYQYVNGYRLKYACDLLANPKCHLRILDIAFEAGYNNKNSFFKAFKDSLGITPNQYRAQKNMTEHANSVTTE